MARRRNRNDGERQHGMRRRRAGELAQAAVSSMAGANGMAAKANGVQRRMAYQRYGVAALARRNLRSASAIAAPGRKAEIYCICPENGVIAKMA